MLLNQNSRGSDASVAFFRTLFLHEKLSTKQPVHEQLEQCQDRSSA